MLIGPGEAVSLPLYCAGRGWPGADEQSINLVKMSSVTLPSPLDLFLDPGRSRTEELLRALFTFDALSFGDEAKARREWRKLLKRVTKPLPKKRGEGRMLISGDVLLGIYDEWIADPPGGEPKHLIKDLAFFLHMMGPAAKSPAKTAVLRQLGVKPLSQRPGATPEAIERRLKRLIEARRRSEAQRQSASKPNLPAKPLTAGTVLSRLSLGEDI